MGEGAKDLGGGVPRWEERCGWGRAVRSKDVTVRGARWQCRLPRAPGRLWAPRCCLLVSPASPRVGDLGSSKPPEQAPASPLLRASLSASTASDGLGPEGQAFLMWCEAGVPLLMAVAHLDLLTLTRGHLPPLSLRSGPTDGLCPARKRRLAGSSGWGGPPPRSPTHPPPRGRGTLPPGCCGPKLFHLPFCLLPPSLRQSWWSPFPLPLAHRVFSAPVSSWGTRGDPLTRGDCLVCVGKGLLKSVHS